MKTKKTTRKKSTRQATRKLLRRKSRRGKRTKSGRVAAVSAVKLRLAASEMRNSYCIAGYFDGMLGSSCEDCGGNMEAEQIWDGSFWRDQSRYTGSGELFWSAYLKPGTGPGTGNGYRLNIGRGSACLASENPKKMLAGPCPRLFYDESASRWVIVINSNGPEWNDIWLGMKKGGTDPAGDYTRIDGSDATAMLTITTCEEESSSSEAHSSSEHTSSSEAASSSEQRSSSERASSSERQSSSERHSSSEQHSSSVFASSSQHSSSSERHSSSQHTSSSERQSSSGRQSSSEPGSVSARHSSSEQHSSSRSISSSEQSSSSQQSAE